MDRFQIKGAPTCRIVYPNGLFEKKQVKGGVGDPKYSAIILIPKDDEAKVAQIKERFAEAFDNLRKQGFTGKTPKSINPKNCCLEDGDDYADEKEGAEDFRGYLRLKVSSKTVRPIVVDKQKRVILNGVPIAGLDVERISDEELGSGDFIFANVQFWTYCNSTAQGIGCNVLAVMRMAPGDPIGGVSHNVDDYISTEGYE